MTSIAMSSFVGRNAIDNGSTVWAVDCSDGLRLIWLKSLRWESGSPFSRILGLHSVHWVVVQCECLETEWGSESERNGPPKKSIMVKSTGFPLDFVVVMLGFGWNDRLSHGTWGNGGGFRVNDETQSERMCVTFPWCAVRWVYLVCSWPENDVITTHLRVLRDSHVDKFKIMCTVPLLFWTHILKPHFSWFLEETSRFTICNEHLVEEPADAMMHQDVC